MPFEGGGADTVNEGKSYGKTKARLTEKDKAYWTEAQDWSQKKEEHVG